MMNSPFTSLLPAPDVLKLLGHDLRWQLLSALAVSDRRVQELVELTARPQNLISYHLRQLRDHHLVAERRSNADGRDVYYSLELGRLRDLYMAGGGGLHPALSCLEPHTTLKDMCLERPIRVLFLCTHNSARSQMAEALFRAYGDKAVVVSSAGSEPSTVHPLAIQVMEKMGISVTGQYSKHLVEFGEEQVDFVITVCDRVREVCPVFPEGTKQIHWSFADPAAVEGTEEARYEAFHETAEGLAVRVRHFLMALKA